MANKESDLRYILDHVATLPEGPDKIDLLKQALQQQELQNTRIIDERIAARKAWIAFLGEVGAFLALSEGVALIAAIIYLIFRRHGSG